MSNIYDLTTSEKWGYSFLGTTLGVSCVFVAPLLFKCFGKKKLYEYLPWFACFGSGVILSLVFNHNLVDSVEVLSFNWKTGSVFLTGIITSFITTFFFSSDDNCCEICIECPECPVPKETNECNKECCEVTDKPITKNTTSTVDNYRVKNWVASLLIGDAFCNFADGIMITTAFILCGHTSGWVTTLAVVLHEITHEIGDFALVLGGGLEFNKAILYNFLSACSSYIGWIIVNSINHYEDTNIICTYFVLYGSGILTSLVLKMLPKYIKHSSVNIQRLRILTVIIGIVLSTLIFTYLSHCEELHHSETGNITDIRDAHDGHGH
jgi:zinc transporter ZupT